MSSLPQFVRGLIVGSLVPIAVLTVFFPSVIDQSIKFSITQSINHFYQWFWSIVGLLTILTISYFYYTILVKPIKKYGFLNQSINHTDQSINQSINQLGALPWTLKSAVSKRNRSKLPIWNPRGWYRLIDSLSVRNSGVLPCSALEQELVIFRAIKQSINQSVNQSFVQSTDALINQPINQSINLPPVSVLDAYCPHLGAHMGYGGKVVLNQSVNQSVSQSVLVCPFHGWEFDGAGICKRIPYAKKVPEIAKTKAYNSVEIMRSIMVWIDVHQSINQSISQPTNQSINQSVNQSIKQSSQTSKDPSKHQLEFLGDEPVLEANDEPINQSIKHSINQSTNQSSNQSINQSVNQQLIQQVNSCTMLSSANQFLNNLSINRLVGSLDFEVGGHIREVWETLIQSRSINQSINQSISQSINQPILTAHRSLSVGWHIDEQSTSPTNNEINQSINQSVNAFQNVACSLIYKLEISVLGMKINRSINQSIIQPGLSLLTITNPINQSINKSMYGILSIIPQSPFVQKVNLSIYGNQSINPIDRLIDWLITHCLIELLRNDARLMQSFAEKRARLDQLNDQLNQSVTDSISQDDHLINQFREWFDRFDQSINQGAQSNQVRRKEGVDW